MKFQFTFETVRSLQADGSRELAECDEGAMQTGLAAHKASLVGCHRSLHEVQHVIAIHGLLQHSHDSQRDGLRRDG